MAGRGESGDHPRVKIDLMENPTSRSSGSTASMPDLHVSLPATKASSLLKHNIGIRVSKVTSAIENLNARRDAERWHAEADGTQLRLWWPTAFGSANLKGERKREVFDREMGVKHHLPKQERDIVGLTKREGLARGPNPYHSEMGSPHWLDWLRMAFQQFSLIRSSRPSTHTHKDSTGLKAEAGEVSRCELQSQLQEISLT